MSEERKPFWAKCPTCAHCWTVAFAPMELGLFAKVVMAGAKFCPKCGATGAVVAKQKDGELMEPTA